MDDRYLNTFMKEGNTSEVEVLILRKIIKNVEYGHLTSISIKSFLTNKWDNLRS